MCSYACNENIGRRDSEGEEKEQELLIGLNRCFKLTKGMIAQSFQCFSLEARTVSEHKFYCL